MLSDRDKLIIEAASYVRAACLMSARADQRRSNRQISKATHRELVAASDELRDCAVALRDKANGMER